MFCHPGYIVKLLFWHRLLNHYNPVLLEPEYHVERLFAVFPSLVRVYGDRNVGNFADSLDHLLVIVETYFYL